MKGQRFPWEVGHRVLWELIPHFEGHCHKLLAVGSYRRRKPDIGDLELLILDREIAQEDPNDLFGGAVKASGAHITAERLLTAGVIAKRLAVNGRVSSWGPENKHATHVATGLALDLFTANAGNWVSLLLCRTGSAEHNVRICAAAKEQGLAWDPYRGFYKGRSWEEAAFRHELPIDPNKCKGEPERQAFRLLQIPYLKPQER